MYSIATMISKNPTMAWSAYSRMIKWSFSAPLNRSDGSFDDAVVLQVSQKVGKEVTRRACIKWSSQFVEDMKPHIESNWTEYTVHRKIELVSLTLEPVRQTCRAVDRVLQVTHLASEKEFLRMTKKTLLTPSLVTELRNWAKEDLRDEMQDADRSALRKRLSDNLKQLEWISSLEACFTEACYAAVRSHIQSTCSQQFEQPLLKDVLEWANRVPSPWLMSMLDQQVLSTAFERLKFFVHQVFGSLRCSEFFDVITAFPDSLSAVRDLKQCLSWTHSTTELINQVRGALKRRLLHGGANTNSILLVYIRLIKTMRELDPQGVILDAVSEPVKQYLRSRPETVRCIVTALTNDGSSGGTNTELYEELGLESGGSIHPIEFEIEDDPRDVIAGEEGYEDTSLWAEGGAPLRSAFEILHVSSENHPHLLKGEENWMPDPIEANPRSLLRFRHSADILGNLVRVYGSKELFVSEYRSLLGERLLLKSSDVVTEAEVRRLELLKLRFGEAIMLPCDVMIRDLNDSRRANAHIKDPQLETVVVSRHFWPQISSMSSSSTLEATSTFKVHPTVREAMESYSAKYAEFKKPRKLVWANHLGMVDLDFVFPDGTQKSFNDLSTLHANMALHFQDRAEWLLSDISRELGLDVEQTRRKLQFWVNEGIVVENRDSKTYTVASTAPQHVGEANESFLDDNQSSRMDVEEEGTGTDPHLEARDGAHLDFVKAMLTNLGPLSLEAIHRNLQLFAGAITVGYDRSETELETFLDDCVSKNLLDKNHESSYTVHSA